MSPDCYVRVRLGAEHYALDVEAVSEVVQLGEVMRMPGAPAHILGVRNLRGEAVPVVDLAALAGPGADGDARVAVVLDDGERRAALTVDAVVDVATLAPPPQAASASELLRASTVVDDVLVGILDHAALLDAAAWGSPAWH